MSFCVEYQANDGSTETLTFGNEAAAARFASTKKVARVLPAEGDAPDVAVRQLAPRGKARPHKVPKAKRPVAKSIANLVPKKVPAERPQGQGPSLMASILAMLSKKEEKAA